MAKLVDWLRRASGAVLDPGREERLEHYVKEFVREIREQGSRFSFEAAVHEGEVPAADVPIVQARIYETFLRRAWADSEITARERSGLEWLKKILCLPAERTSEVELRVGKEILEQALASALADGHVSESEAKQLKAISSTLGIPLGGFVSTYFSNWSEGFLRALFASIIEDGTITRHEWATLIEASSRLGLTEQHVIETVQSQAQMFVEHVLADAKSDGKLSSREATTLVELLELLRLEPSFKAYVQQEVDKLRVMTEILDGRLPSLSIHHVSLRAGELVHFKGFARYERTKHLASGPRVDTADGEMLITDCRALFNSDVKSFSIGFASIVDVIELTHSIQIRSGGKGSGDYYFGDNHKLAGAVLCTAIRRANQTVVERRDSLPTRHIIREVRQRVWQKYSGRCAECGSGHYLEFDHIIPVAKGGGNVENNVQLLCRKCNLSKSDHI